MVTSLSALLPQAAAFSMNDEIEHGSFRFRLREVFYSSNKPTASSRWRICWLNTHCSKKVGAITTVDAAGGRPKAHRREARILPL